MSALDEARCGITAALSGLRSQHRLLNRFIAEGDAILADWPEDDSDARGEACRVYEADRDARSAVHAQIEALEVVFDAVRAMWLEAMKPGATVAELRAGHVLDMAEQVAA